MNPAQPSTVVIVEPGVYPEGLVVQKSLEMVAADGLGDCSDTTSGAVTVEVVPPGGALDPVVPAVNIDGPTEPIEVRIEDIGFLTGRNDGLGGTMSVFNATVEVVNSHLLNGSADLGGCLGIQQATVDLIDTFIAGCSGLNSSVTTAVEIRGKNGSGDTSLSMLGGAVAGPAEGHGIRLFSGTQLVNEIPVDLAPVELVLEDTWVHDAEDHGIIAQGTDASVELWGTTVVEDHGSTGVIVLNESTLLVTGQTEIRGNSGDLQFGVTVGGGVVAMDDSVVVVGGTAWIHDNDADLGGGIFADSSHVELTNGSEVSSNTAASGAGVFVTACGYGQELGMSGGAFVRDNVATAEGGGVFADGCDVTLEDYSGMLWNDATDGGGVRMVDGDLVATHTTVFDHNTATEDGGAVHVSAPAAALLTDHVEVANNSAGERGGAIFAEDAVVQLHLDAIVRNGYAGVSGGGVHQQGGTLEVFDSVALLTNATDGDGGAIHASGAMVALMTADGLIDIGTNTAVDGAGLWLDQCATLIQTLPSTGRVWVHGGVASGDGGGIWMRGGTLLSEFDLLIGAVLDPLLNTPVAGQGNVAAGAGGGIYADQEATITLDGHMWWLDSANGPAGCDQSAGEQCPVAELNQAGFAKVVGNIANGGGASDVTGGGIFLDDVLLRARHAVISHNDADPTASYPSVDAAGGGLALTNGATAELSSTTVHLNHAGLGGGVHMEGGSVLVTDSYADNLQPLQQPSGLPLGDTCSDRVTATQAPFNRERDRYCTEISFNTATDGGGINVEASTATLENVGLLGNDASNDRAAIWVGSAGSVVLSGSLVADNDSNRRSAVSVVGGSDLDARTTTMSQGYGVYVQSSTVALDNSILWHDSMIGFDMLYMVFSTGSGDCNMGQGVDQLSGTNNDEDIDPQFVTVPETAFFPDVGSPAIGACTPGAGSAFDLLGDPTHQTDRGAFEG